jgi:hypothetical protein
MPFTARQVYRKEPDRLHNVRIVSLLASATEIVCALVPAICW